MFCLFLLQLILYVVVCAPCSRRFRVWRREYVEMIILYDFKLFYFHLQVYYLTSEMILYCFKQPMHVHFYTMLCSTFESLHFSTLDFFLLYFIFMLIILLPHYTFQFNSHLLLIHRNILCVII